MSAPNAPPAPFWLRWSESSAHDATLKSPWANAVVSGIILVVNGAIIGLLVRYPTPGKVWPWYLIVYVIVCFVGLLLGLTSPLWGGQRLRFEGGVFTLSSRWRNETKLSLSLGGLRAFETAQTADGHQVVAVRTNGDRLPLDLSLENVFHSVSGRGKAADDLRSGQNAREATFVAARLNAMLERVLEDHGSYRN